MKSISETGVLGDPRKANEDVGRKIMEKLSDYYVEKIRREFRN
ncbi:MAG: hypothetical protein QXX09_00540 [Candidatus Methanomethylicia archaeon]